MDNSIIGLKEKQDYLNEYAIHNTLYTVGEPLFFSKEKHNFEPYYLSGLSGIETTGTTGAWSSGKETLFLFRLPQHIGQALSLEFTRYPLKGKGLDHQTVKVSANNVLIEQLEIYEGGTFNVTLSPISTDGLLEIKFEFPTAATPKSLSINNDERMLAFWFDQVVPKSQHTCVVQYF
ncbi:MAG: hypothetical protein LBP19_10390 [Treponema sp.]|nr:hypothetical protein [Treponema sp.]